MKGLFNSLRRNNRKCPRRQQSVRLAFEGLEERQVMSASSLMIHAVQDNVGSAVFYTKTDGVLYEKDSSGAVNSLAGGGWTNAFSAGVDQNGRAAVFATGTDNTMWEYNSSGWHFLDAPEVMTEFAAVKGDRVFAVGADNALWEYSPPWYFHHFWFGGWAQLSGPGTVQYVDAVTQASGYDAVFAVMQDGSLQESNAGGAWQWLATPNFFQMSSISVGLDTNGNADVFGLSNYNDQLWRWTAAGDWVALGAPNQIFQISATTNGQVEFLTQGDHWLQKYDAQGNLHDLYHSYFTEVSAAASNDVYVVNWDSTLWDRAADNTWHYWDSYVA
jgi:hypothetical protein